MSFYKDTVARGEIILALRDISDMQRLAGRCVYGTAGGRDLRTLSNCAAVLPRLKELTARFTGQELKSISAMDALEDMRAQIDRAIADDPPFSVREGGILRPGYSEELDRLRSVRDNGRRWSPSLSSASVSAPASRSSRSGITRCSAII